MNHRTILIADDEAEIRELIRLYLERENFATVQAGNGLEALGLLAANIDLVIADIMMPVLNGYDLIKKIREQSRVPVIAVSAKSENYEKILGLDIGADDYVTKPFDPLELTARVKAQLRRSGTGVGFEAGGLNLDTDACRLVFGDTSVDLTATEFNIMKLFMQSPGRVFTKRNIYDYAWPDSFMPDDNTVMVALSKLRAKLPAECGVAIKTIRGLGYRLEVL